MGRMKNGGENDTQQVRLWTPVFVGILVITLCCFLVGQGLNSGTSVYLAVRGATATLAGIGAAVFSAAAAITRIVCGPLADRRGRLIVIAVGAVVLLCGTLGAAVFTDLDLFVLWRLLQGLGFAAVTTAAATAAADVLPVERLGEGIGYYGLGQAVAMSFGPALALFLVATDPPENLFWGVSVFAVLSFAVSFFCHYERNISRLPETATFRTLAEKRAREEADRANAASKGEAIASAGVDADAKASVATKPRLLDSILEPGALAGAVPIMVMAPTFGFGIFFSGLLGTTLGVPGAGTFYTVSAIAMIVVRLSSRTFMDRIAPLKLHAFAACFGVVYCLTLIAACQFAADEGLRNGLFYFAGIPYGLCLGVAMPVNQAVAVKNSPAERWGAANGLYLLLVDVGIGGGAIAWGVTNDYFGFTVTLAIVIVLVVASVAAARLSYPGEKPGKRL